jgi:CheY-like chemotaxis protein
MEKRFVLAIEHDWRLRRLIQANLEPLGFEVQAAVDGLHSLELLRGSRPDLILLDADLPDMYVNHLLDRLSALLDGQVPIIILSAEPPDRQCLHNGQVVSFLLKPFAAPALLQQVRQALGESPAENERTASDK